MRLAPGTAWVAVAGLLAAGALAVTAAQAVDARLAGLLDWQPRRAWPEAWRPWTAAWVHWSAAHLAVNLAGAAALAWLGWRARAGTAQAGAWLAAWPLTQALLDVPAGGDVLAGAALRHYGGLSGVLHAGVVVLGLGLAFPGPAAAADGLEPLGPARRRRHRLVGAALLLGTGAKVLLEAPWDEALRPSALLGIGVAPVAHACGVAAGALAAAAAAGVARVRVRVRARMRVRARVQAKRRGPRS